MNRNKRAKIREKNNKMYLEYWEIHDYSELFLRQRLRDRTAHRHRLDRDHQFPRRFLHSFLFRYYPICTWELHAKHSPPPSSSYSDSQNLRWTGDPRWHLRCPRSYKSLIHCSKPEGDSAVFGGRLRTRRKCCPLPSSPRESSEIWPAERKFTLQRER